MWSVDESQEGPGAGRHTKRGVSWRVWLVFAVVAPVAMMAWLARPEAAGAEFQKLRLTSMCSDDPDSYRVWRVRNFNEQIVEFEWDVYGTGQSGSGSAPAAEGGEAGVAFFETETVPGPNTTRIFVDGVLNDTKASSPSQCPTSTPTPTETSTPTPTETSTPTPTETSTPTPTETSTPTPTETSTPTLTETSTPTPTETFTPEPTATPTPAIPGDVNGDGAVNTLDVGRIGLHWQETGTPCWIPEDVNCDGVINTLDVATIGLYW